MDTIGKDSSIARFICSFHSKMQFNSLFKLLEGGQKSGGTHTIFFFGLKYLNFPIGSLGHSKGTYSGNSITFGMCLNSGPVPPAAKKKSGLIKLFVIC